MSRIIVGGRESGPGGRSSVVIALTLGLLIGAGAGSLIVGPLLAESGGSISDAELEARCEALFAEWDVEMRPPIPAAVHTIENLVLNPARSGGTRFLMASVAFAVRDQSGAELIVARDAEIRDIVIRTLGSRTVPELADMHARNEMKEEMRAEVARIIGQRTLIDIYFPQFVLQ